MDHRSYAIAWILSTPDHHSIATSFFDETYHQFHSAAWNMTYSTGRVGQHNVVAASKGTATTSQNSGDVVDNLLQEFPSIRAGFLVSVNAITSHKGPARVGDVVVGTRPSLQNGILYFNAKETREQNRLVVTGEPKHVPEQIAEAVEGFLNQKGRNDWLRAIAKGSTQCQRMVFRGLIASSKQLLNDAVLVDRLRGENNVVCFETTAASIKSQSLTVVAGIAGYAGSGQNDLPSAEVCKLVISYLSCLTRRVNTNVVSEPPLTSYYHYEPIDLERPGFRLLSLERGFKGEPIRCRIFQAYLYNKSDEANKHNDLSLIPYEALSYCWGDSTRLRHTVAVDGKVLFVTENLLDALKNLRRDYEDRILWVDALCIDQSNIRERGHQVECMGKVYEYADSVLCWLGHVEHTTSHLITLFQRFKRNVPQVAWENWPLHDSRWSHTWEQTLSGQPNHDYPSLLRRLMANEWFSRVWILQEVANAGKASLGCSEGWVDSKSFTMAPTLLGVQPDSQCQAIIDIMPGPSRKFSWWSQESNISTLLWRFRDCQASDPRDRLYALRGLASDGKRFEADYTKTEEAVMRDVVAYLFDQENPSDTFGPANIADLQIKIPDLSAITLEKKVLSGAMIEEVKKFMQKQNSTVSLSEAVINYTWCTQSDLMAYFETGPAFQDLVLGDISQGLANKHTKALGRYLEEREGYVLVTQETMQAISRNGIDLAQLVSQPGRDDIKVTAALVKHIARQGLDSFKMLLNSRMSEVADSIIRAREFDGDLMVLLLDQQGEKFQITEDFVKMAAGNSFSGEEAMKLLLDRRGDEVKITENVIKEAVGNRPYGQKIIKLLLDRRGEEVKITEDVVKAAVGNRVSGEKVMRLLLDRRGEEINITEDVVKVAVGNRSSGKEVMSLLFDQRGEEIKITEDIVKEAIGNILSGEKVIKLLLDRRGEEIKITDDIVKAAVMSRDEKVTRLLLDRKQRLKPQVG
ncbi:ankyrin repeat and SAM domain containing protein 6 [Colletotrichum truncatum]|uniref:Ankyrin repeat and SAM domain containing protein 6 n=1 Tax=Colletotrichum truncatum TaxID=5467 RepID=A0ACC3YE11_COLTU|nr:ankyrin repeat and SAM domain containing protein 6 [Colletotrichum truncatum]KAF6790254.1 ankyrin repeat and SAM domain containing protein 6 [Colletotrichum truncatum]